MLGLFGTSIIGTDHLTGPVADSETKSARFARHDLTRGKPILQDLGNDAGTKQLRFFFDETFCDVEAELRKIELAFQARVPMKLFFDLKGFEVGVFVIQRLTTKHLKTTRRGRLVRAELQVELIESVLAPGSRLGAAAGRVRAALNPALRRLL